MFNFENHFVKETTKKEKELGLPISSKKEEAIEKKVARLGTSLIIVDKERTSQTVEKYLGDLSLLPDKMVDTLKQWGIKVVIGAGDAASTATVFNSESGNRFNKVEEFAKKNNMRVSGFYMPIYKVVFVSSVSGGQSESYFLGNKENTGTSSVALHEYGHGFADFLGINNAREAIEAHERLSPKLRAHVRQSGPRDAVGVKELIADSFSDYFTMKEDPNGMYANIARFIKVSIHEYQFTAKYDEAWFRFMKKTVDSLAK